MKKKTTNKQQKKPFFFRNLIYLFYLLFFIVFSFKILYSISQNIPLTIDKIVKEPSSFLNISAQSGTAFTYLTIDSCGNITTGTNYGSSTCVYLIDTDGNLSNGCESYYTQNCTGGNTNAECSPSPLPNENEVEVNCNVTAQGKKASCSDSCPGYGDCILMESDSKEGTITVDNTHLQDSLTITLTLNAEKSYTDGSGKNWYKGVSFNVVSQDNKNDQDFILIYINNQTPSLLPLQYSEMIRNSSNTSLPNSNSISASLGIESYQTEGKIKVEIEVVDNDICKEIISYLTNFINIDQKPPQLITANNPMFTEKNSSFYRFNVVEHMLNTSKLRKKEIPIIFDSNDFYNKIFILKNTKLYEKYSRKPAIYFGDFGSGIKNLVVNSLIPSCNYTISDENLEVYNNITNLSGEYVFKKIIFTNYTEGCVLNITAIDNTDNQKNYLILIPSPNIKSQCYITKSIKNYTSLKYIKCNVSSSTSSSFFNKNLTFYIKVTPYYTTEEEAEWKETPLSKKYEKNRDSYYYTKVIEGSSSFFLNNVNPSSLGLPQAEGIFNNYYLIFFVEDAYNNFEKIKKISEDFKYLYIEPNILPINLDLAPPTLLLSNLKNITIENSTTITENGTDYFIFNKSTFLKINAIPSSFKLKCEDNSFCKYLNVTICDYIGNCDSYSNKSGINSSLPFLSLFINMSKYPQLIKITTEDQLGNKKEINYRFEELSNIQINYVFNDTYIDKTGNTYTFLNDVILNINATLDGNLSKIKYIKINNSVFSNPCNLTFHCDIGKECKFNLEIEATSVYETTEKEKITVIINKKPGSCFITFLPTQKIFFNYTNTGNNNNSLLIISYCIPRRDFNVSLLTNQINLFKKGFLIFNKSLPIISLTFPFKNFTNNGEELFIKNYCIFNVSGTIQTCNSSKKMIYDKEGPQIKIKINNTLINSSFFSTSTNTSINFTFYDNLSGFKKAFISYDNNKISINFPLNSTTINLTAQQDEEKEIHFIIEGFDNLNNKKEITFTTLLDRKAPFVYKQIISKNDEKTKLKFICNDKSKCNFEEIKCNNHYITCTITSSCAICECNYSNNKTLYEVKVKDMFGNEKKYTFVEFKGINEIYSKIMGIKINKGETKEIFCAKNTIIPILIELKNYNDKKNKILRLKGEKVFIKYPNQLILNKLSSMWFTVFVKCEKGKYSFVVKEKEENKIIQNFTLFINPLEITFNTFYR